jgi:hypothetical protein
MRYPIFIKIIIINRRTKEGVFEVEEEEEKKKNNFHLAKKKKKHLEPYNSNKNNYLDTMSLCFVLFLGLK